MSSPTLAPVVAITNHKGGVGKTTTAVNLAAELGLLGHNVLVIDLDPQANASLHLGVAHPASLGVNASALFKAETVEAVADAIQTQVNPGFKNTHFIPGSLSLDHVEDHLRAYSPQPYKELAARIEPLRSAYDILIIDCPPRLGLLSGNAIAAATHYLIPIETNSQYPLHGVTDLHAFINRMSKALNPGLANLGVLLTRHDERRRACKAIAQSAQDMVGSILPMIIHSSAKVGEASVSRCPIRKIERDGRVTQDYQSLAAYLSQTLELKKNGDSA